jgi:hypothetical protein
VFGINLKTDGVTKKMTDKNLQDVASEMEAHERECSVYRQMTTQRLDSVDSRIKKLEVLLWSSSGSIIALLITIILNLLK